MDASAPAADFPITRCASCQKDVLCYFDLDGPDADAAEIIRCLECSTAIALEAVRWVDFHDLEALGYGDALPEADCGRPDCGRGRCGRST
jgi:hypothetical protein